MQGTLGTVIRVTIVAVSMVTGFLFYQRFQPEAFILPEEEIVGMREVLTEPDETYTGKTAGEGIPHLESIRELADRKLRNRKPADAFQGRDGKPAKGRKVFPTGA